MVHFAVAAGSELLARNLFGEQLELLDVDGAHRVGGVVSSWDSSDTANLLEQVDVIVTGWGAPALTEDLLERSPGLKALIHAGGSAAGLLPPTTRQLAVSVSALENAQPVAEWTVAMIVLANKAAFDSQQRYRTERRFLDREQLFPHAGNRRKTVGLIGASRIGRQVIELLRPFELHVLVSDPFLTSAEASKLGVESVELAELFSRSDVVSVHAPELPSTRHLVSGELLASMPIGATLINTARGSLIDQEALIALLRHRRLQAILDVTEPDVLPGASELYELDNVFLTPHMAGSTGTELRRLGEHVAGELRRFVNGQPFNEPEMLPPKVR